MPKKRKTTHSISPDTPLTHDQIWDDSALLDSWNEAKAEFEKYHSLHARGIKVEAALKAHDQEQDTGEGEEGEGGEAEEGEMNDTDDVGEVNTKQANTQAGGEAGVGPQMPGLLATGIDESLKPLLMSWYYAGYYTGLYEGQKAALGQTT